jgi:hypothetical protein
MKIIPLITSFFLITIIVSGQPKISLEKPDIDLGTIYSGQKVSAKIMIKNIGSDSLQILSVSPQCGCTAVKKPKEVLKPNESDMIEIEFNSRGYHSSVTKYVDVFSNDPSSSRVTFRIIADVREELQQITSVSNTLMGNVPVGTMLEKDIKLKNISGHPISVKTAANPSSSVNVKLNKTRLNPDDTLTVSIKMRAEKTGYWMEYFSIETDSKNQPSVEIRTSYVGLKQQ